MSPGRTAGGSSRPESWSGGSAQKVDLAAVMDRGKRTLKASAGLWRPEEKPDREVAAPGVIPGDDPTDGAGECRHPARDEADPTRSGARHERGELPSGVHRVRPITSRRDLTGTGTTPGRPTVGTKSLLGDGNPRDPVLRR